MSRNNMESSRRRGAMVAVALSALLMTGCVNAVFDAAAAGALSFIETGVITSLSGTVFGTDGTTSAATVSDTTSDEMHDAHGG